MLQVGEDVHVAPADDLLQHGVDDDVAAGPANPGTAAQSVLVFIYSTMWSHMEGWQKTEQSNFGQLTNCEIHLV